MQGLNYHDPGFMKPNFSLALKVSTPFAMA